MKVHGHAASALAAWLCLAAAAAEPAPPRRVAGPLDAGGSFDGDIDMRQAASGVACAGDACVVVFDEGRSARFAKLTRDGYIAHPEPLVLREGPAKDELDAEAAAIGDGALYVVGSHAMARKERPNSKKIAPDADGLRCKPHPSARGLFRLALDPATGLPARNAEAQEPKGEGLLGAVRRVGLGEAIDRCLGLGKGLDIEGLAFQRDKLSFGLRGPKPAPDRAYVLVVEAEPLFVGADPQPSLKEVPVGEGRAIRDMQAVDGGFLLLVGPDDRLENATKPFSVIFWDGNGSVADLGALPVAGVLRPHAQAGCTDKEIKPEALSVAEGRPDGWTVAVLSDGMCDGGPMWFELSRP